MLRRTTPGAVIARRSGGSVSGLASIAVRSAHSARPAQAPSALLGLPLPRWLRRSRDGFWDAVPLAALLRASGGPQGSRPPSGDDDKDKEAQDKDKDKDKDKDGKEDGDGDGDNEDANVFRSALRSVLAVVLVSGVLYYYARPAGEHLSWSHVTKHATEVVHFDIYARYAQVFFSDGGVAYVGLTGDDAHTDHCIAGVRAVAAAARKAAALADAAAPSPPDAAEKSSAAAATASAGAAGEQKGTTAAAAAAAAATTAPATGSSGGAPLTVAGTSRRGVGAFTSAASGVGADDDSLLITTRWVGTSVSEEGLRLVGAVAWMVPFFFFPIFALVLTRMTGNTLGAALGQDKGRLLTKSKMFTVSKHSDVRFADVAGMHEAKQEVTEIVDFLRKPGHYTKLGAKIPTGALLLGPPGTGKTLLAKAVAGEAGVPFIATAGSDFVELYVGMGALRVRQLFELARQQKDCIIYIDEIDAVGLRRRGAGQGEQQEQEHTLNELLTQLDGFDSAVHEGRIMVLASSNVALDALDPALVRPGRFDRIVHVDAPVISERVEIFHTHLRKLRLLPDDPPTPVPAPDAAAAPTPTDAASTEGGAPVPPAAAAAVAVDGAAAVPVDGATAATTETPPAATASAPAAPAQTSTALVVMAELPGTAGASSSTAKAGATTSGATSTTAIPIDTTLPPVEIAKRPGAAHERAVLVDSYAKRMSDLCPGFVGADLASICNEAAILAAREDATHVTVSHLERSIDRVIAGIEMRSRMLSDFERRVVAYHEAGHAIAGWYLNRADPLMKVSIVPRGGKALGYAQYLPAESRMRTARDMEDSICVTLGGRVAEKIFFGHLSTGASDDLLKITRMAYHYVTSFNASTAHAAPGTRETAYAKPYGAAISRRIDGAAKDLVDRMYQRTYDLLLSRREEMEMLAKHLLKHEVLTHQDVLNYLGKRETRPVDYRVA